MDRTYDRLIDKGEYDEAIPCNWRRSDISSVTSKKQDSTEREKSRVQHPLTMTTKHAFYQGFVLVSFFPQAHCTDFHKRCQAFCLLSNTQRCTKGQLDMNIFFHETMCWAHLYITLVPMKCHF
jgi:hypothetical protein